MTTITTRLIVTEDGRLSTTQPLPAGEHFAVAEIVARPPFQAASEPFSMDAFPVFDLGPWPEGLSLRREDMYGDDGR